MAIAAKGYRHWEGSLRGRGFRWWTIARWGVKQTAKSKWLKRLVLAAWLPLLYGVVVFFLAGQLTEVRTVEVAEDMTQFKIMRAMFGTPLAEGFIEDPTSFRPMIWGSVMFTLLRWQLFVVMIVVVMVGPRLISQDMVSRSLALYFAKPLTRFDYIVGKLGVVGFWVGTVTLAPSLVLYGLSILFSPSLEAVSQTIHIVPALMLVALLLMVGTGAPMLALSSLTRNTRFLGFVWGGFWVMTHVASFILSFALKLRGRRAPEDAEDWTGLVSYAKNFDAVAFRVFDLENLLQPAVELSPKVSRWMRDWTYDHDWRLSLLLLLALSAVSLVVVAQRIGRPGEAGSK